MLSAAGLDEDGMRQWHQEFENRAPQAHQAFLRSLGISQSEIRRIRNWSKNQKGN
jgi:hypothetical protein